MIRNSAFAVLIAVLLPGFVLASEAGLVVKKSSGELKQVCVSFDSDSISGWELLSRSGLNPVQENGFVVEIDSMRSKSPSLMSSNDPFWSYWKYSNGWRFSSVGANYSRVKDGEIEGWELGSGKSSLPEVSFSSICVEEEATEAAAQSTAAGDQVEVQAQPSPQGKPVAAKSKQISSASEKEVSPSDTSTTGTVAGESDAKDRFDFSFNLKNIMIVFLIFLLGGAVFLFAKVLIRKFSK